MPEPTEVATVMGITLPFTIAALLFTLRACFKNLKLHRVILAASCILAIITNLLAMAMCGTYPVDNISIVYLSTVTAYNTGLWLTRLYVCIRMAKLCPNPDMGALFDRLAYVAGTLFVMTMSAYIISAIHFYKSHDFEEVAATNETGVAIILIAEVFYEIASLYLHVICLKSIASFNATGLKLVVISCSTLTCIAFDMIQCSAMMTGDGMLEMMMGSLLIAGLPSSIVLGELLVIYIGRRAGKSMKSTEQRSGGGASKPGNTKSSVSKTRTVKATSSLPEKEDPIRQPPVLAQPSI